MPVITRRAAKTTTVTYSNIPVPNNSFTSTSPRQYISGNSTVVAVTSNGSTPAAVSLDVEQTPAESHPDTPNMSVINTSAISIASSINCSGVNLSRHSLPSLAVFKKPSKARINSTITLSNKTKIDFLQTEVSQLRLKLTLLEPLKSQIDRLTDRVASLEALLVNGTKNPTADEFNDALLQTTNSTHGSIAVPASSLAASYYPPPDIITEDGKWFVVGSNRVWCKDEASYLKALKKEKRRRRRRTKRRAERLLRSSRRDLSSQLIGTSPGTTSQQSSTSGNSSCNHGSHNSWEQGHVKNDAIVNKNAIASKPKVSTEHAPRVLTNNISKEVSPRTYTWLYVSNVSNNTSAETIFNYLCQKLKHNDIYCHPLIPRGVDPRSRRTMSFKVRILSSDAAIATKTNFWPNEVRVRYFVPDSDFTHKRQMT